MSEVDMNDDVKAAVERLARIKNGESCIKVYAPPGTEETRANAGYTMGQHMHDEYIVADYVVEQHRLDTVPLTEAVLRASGASEQPYGWSWSTGGPALFSDLENCSGGWRVSGMTRNARVKTAGDLQRLCDALHLGVTVVVPESEVAE